MPQYVSPRPTCHIPFPRFSYFQAKLEVIENQAQLTELREKVKTLQDDQKKVLEQIKQNGGVANDPALVQDLIELILLERGERRSASSG